MSFNRIAYPEELQILTEAVQNFCRAEGIQPGTADYEDAAHLVMHLFNSGVASPREIHHGLKMGLNRQHAVKGKRSRTAARPSPSSVSGMAMPDDAA
jgi:hypothetical protein